MEDINWDDIENLKDLIYNDEVLTEKKEINAVNKCNVCNSDKIIEDCSMGILVCKNCGQVLSTVTDSNPEWQNNNDGTKETTKTSSVVNKLLPQSSISTTIRGMQSRLKMVHSWSAMPYNERSLNDVFKEIQAKCTIGKISKYSEDYAKMLYKNINECKIITRGSNRKSLIAACVFFACRKNDKTRSPKEIARIFNLKFTEITKGCKLFLKFAKIQNIDLNFIFIKPEHFIKRFCESMKIKQEYADQAIKIVINVQKICIAEMHTPISIASGAIYLMSEINNSNITKEEIADKFNISQVTVSKSFRKIEKFKHILDDDELCDQLQKAIIQYKNSLILKDSTITRFIRFGIIHPNMFNFIKNNEPDMNLIMAQTFELDLITKMIDNRYFNEILMDDIIHPVIF